MTAVSAPSATSLAPSWADRMDVKLRSKDIPGLYGIRAAAVMLVILYHFGFDDVSAALGVEMFFTLSGFLITWLLLRTLDGGRPFSFKDFYLRRTLRIFPALYVYIALGLAISLLRHHDIPWSQVISAIFFVQNYNDAIFHTPDSFVDDTWSLGIEEQFYLLWPIVFYRYRHDLAKLTRILVGIIALAWTLRLVLQYGVGVYQGYIYHAFETRMDQIAMGCLLAVLLKRRALTPVFRAATAHPVLPALVIAALYVSSSHHVQPNYRYPLAYTIEPLLTALLLVQLVWFSEHPVWRLANSAPLVFLGRISYSMYLYQQLTLFTARRLTESYALPVQFAFALAVTIAMATLSYHLVEQRFRLRR